MKKLLLPLIAILLFTSCKKEINTDKVPGNIIMEKSDASAKSTNNKIDVCHYNAVTNTWHMININVNAWPAHAAHGDIRLDDQDDDNYVPDNACGYGQMGDCNDNNASINPGATEICGNSIDDNCNGQIDENCIPFVTICGEDWMLKNLDVSTYRNGDPIPQITNPVDWLNSTTGAWCYYANNTSNGLVYGKLYNWYAVNDPRGLAPVGWHVPSDAEWTTLIDCLGGFSVAGGALKETGTTHWGGTNVGATNSSGFTALPGGLCTFAQGFLNINFDGLWWSSTEESVGSNYAWYYAMTWGSAEIGRGSTHFLTGLSVRCIRD